jgi:uncharacterized phage-associated protein
MHSASAVAQAFLDLAASEEKQLTNMQVQKLVFFAHGVHLAAFGGAPLVAEEARAWDFGPVIPELYEKLRRFGRGAVSAELNREGASKVTHDADAMQAIRSVWKAYSKYEGWQLSNISHIKGGPWDTVWNGSEGKYAAIPNDLIREYYAKRIKRGSSSAA